jgi:cholesterol transport system auxiliary component
LSLAGCVSVLPKTKPAQLYSFVRTEKPSAPDAVEAKAPTGLLLGGLTFPRAASSDGILTRTGAEAAYIGGARWVGPASLLFREATDNTFDRSGSLRLLSRGEVGKASAILRLEVRDFEARYSDPGAPPTAVVSVDARLSGAAGVYIGARRFEAATRASDNRVGPIVEAMAASTDKVLSDAAAWIEGQAADLPSPTIEAPVATPRGGPPAAPRP